MTLAATTLSGNDAVRAASVEAPPPDIEFGPLFGERFIAQVRDGRLKVVKSLGVLDPKEGQVGAPA